MHLRWGRRGRRGRRGNHLLWAQSFASLVVPLHDIVVALIPECHNAALTCNYYALQRSTVYDVD